MVENKLVKAAISLWNGSSEDYLKLTGGFQNDVYVYTYKNEKRILRITSSNLLLDPNTLGGEMKFIESLDRKGISVSRPHLSIQNKYIEEVIRNGQYYYISSFSYADGSPINVSSPGEWNRDFFLHWGRTMGKMHSISKELGLSTINRPNWNSASNDLAEIKTFLSSVSQKATDAFELLLNKIDSLPKERNTFGLIHNDFHQGNFFVQEGQMSIFDFADCCYCWFAQDIAVSFYHAVWQGMAFNPETQEFPVQFLNSFFEGYRQENELSQDILMQIPLFLKLREFFLYTLFHKKWNLHLLEDWQNYTLSDLRYRIENEIAYSDLRFESYF